MQCKAHAESFKRRCALEVDALTGQPHTVAGRQKRPSRARGPARLRSSAASGAGTQWRERACGRSWAPAPGSSRVGIAPELLPLAQHRSRSWLVCLGSAWRPRCAERRPRHGAQPHCCRPPLTQRCTRTAAAQHQAPIRSQCCGKLPSSQARSGAWHPGIIPEQKPILPYTPQPPGARVIAQVGGDVQRAVVGRGCHAPRHEQLDAVIEEDMCLVVAGPVRHGAVHSPPRAHHHVAADPARRAPPRHGCRRAAPSLRRTPGQHPPCWLCASRRSSDRWRCSVDLAQKRMLPGSSGSSRPIRLGSKTRWWATPGLGSGGCGVRGRALGRVGRGARTPRRRRSH